MNIMVDSWYANYLNYEGFSFTSWLESHSWYRWAKPIISRSGLIRGIFLYFCARQSCGAIVACDIPGFWTFLFLRTLFGTPGNCFVLEFIRRRPLSSINRLLYPIWFNTIVLPATRKGISKAQVMTQWERYHYAGMFGVNVDKFVHIPFPMHRVEPRPERIRKLSNRIMSSGRQSCDWETLLCVVADLPQYQLLIVHSQKDYYRLKRLKLPSNCKLLSDIPQIEHDRLLAESTCYVISLLDTVGSSGQVRLSHAIHVGSPVIVTAVAGIEEYVVDGETAIVVPPGDPDALRKAIQKLMADPVLQTTLADNAKRHAEKWTRNQYFDRLSEIIQQESSWKPLILDEN